MILFQVVCGAEKDCSYSLKEKLGAMAELDNAYAQKRQDNALESTVDALHSVTRKEFASRLRWTALCINAARLGEVHFRCLLYHDHFITLVSCTCRISILIVFSCQRAILADSVGYCCGGKGEFCIQS
jgi:hypothetical protein